jgi:hypothetical protein
LKPRRLAGVDGAQTGLFARARYVERAVLMKRPRGFDALAGGIN